MEYSEVKIEKTTIQRLNELFVNTFGNGDISTLNPVRFIDSEQSGVTIAPDHEDAFHLGKPSIGNIQQYLGAKPQNKTAVYRNVLGYTMATRVLEDETLFIYTMSLLINDGLRQLTREVGDLTGKKVTLARPEQPGRIFRDLDNSAGYEIRMMVVKQ
jgi:hypothetical protein